MNSFIETAMSFFINSTLKDDLVKLFLGLISKKVESFHQQIEPSNHATA
jgi:hypothetical protein